MLEYLFSMPPLVLAGLIAIPVLLILFIVFLVWRRRRGPRGPRRPKKEKTMIPRLQIGIVHCIGTRESQQDSYAVSGLSGGRPTSPCGFLALVADGMGGLSHGDEISELAAKSFIESFEAESGPADPDGLLIEYLSVANGRINAYMKENDIVQAGSTLVAAIVADKYLHFVSVGDSRIYLHRGGGLIQLNREHSYGAQLDALAAGGSVKPGHARSDMFRKALTSYLGMGNLEQVDKPASPLRLMRGDRIVIASDGIFSALPDADIADMLCGTAMDSAYALEQAIAGLQRTSQDNYTAIVILYR